MLPHPAALSSEMTSRVPLRNRGTCVVVQRSSVGRGAEECQSGEAHAGMCWVDQLTCKNYGVHGKDVARGGDGTWWAGAVRVSVKVDVTNCKTEFVRVSPKMGIWTISRLLSITKLCTDPWWPPTSSLPVQTLTQRSGNCCPIRLSHSLCTGRDEPSPLHVQ